MKLHLRNGSTSIEDLVCGFLAGATLLFNLGLWLLPKIGIASGAVTCAICIIGGAAFSAWLFFSET